MAGDCLFVRETGPLKNEEVPGWVPVSRGHNRKQSKPIDLPKVTDSRSARVASLESFPITAPESSSRCDSGGVRDVGD